MIKIRLQRFGSNKKPFYRVVAADVSAPRDGKFIEMIGTYDPLQTPAVVKIDKEKAAKWISNGAKPTETVKSLFKKYSILDK
ncbi:MAG TPA: 30S ribosomal protein S16 [Acholeplasma sp.]|nr:30S ribosomal protein S16 [Acholeplasma sp.]